MQSLTNLIVKTTPQADQDDARGAPAAFAMFVVVLAVVISLGAFWLGSTTLQSSAQAAPVAFEEE